VVVASGLFDDEVTYDGDDLVRGAVGRTPFALGDVRAGIRRRGAVTGGFRGLLFHAEFNRSLNGRTLVLAEGRKPEAVPGNRGLATVTLENPEFEALFSVHASDPVEARYVLTGNDGASRRAGADRVSSAVRGLRPSPRVRGGGPRPRRVRGARLRREKAWNEIGLRRALRLRASDRASWT
jgi:hypothetical protein